MNFLAHSLLAHGRPAAVAGQFSGDFVRGREAPLQYAPAIRAGILMHRKIDVFTDAHPELLLARRRFDPPYRRLAGILIDVLFDHFLARDWARYSDQPLVTHITQVHAALNEHHDHLPASLQRFSAYLQRERILMSYRSIAGVEATYRRLAGRSAVFAPMADALAPVLRHETALAGHFQRFYPQLDEYVLALEVDLAQ